MAKNAQNHPMWIVIPGIHEPGKIKAIFTTRHGGVSGFPYHTLNLSFQRADSRGNVLENFRRLSIQTGIAMNQMVLSRQVHGDAIGVVDESHCGMGLVREHQFGNTDALITDKKNVALVTFYADCTPVYLYDKVKSIIGLVHSGWRGTLLNISAKAVATMKHRFHCDAEDIIVAIGPHIRRCCFEVGLDVFHQFAKVFPDCVDLFEQSDVKWRIDLSGIITRTLLEQGIKEENLHDIQRCTVCEKELFFSHRGGVGNTGTGAALLMMVE